ncbi:dolichyl-phosphate beta-D-mannosyltransferase [bacterium]|nr:dolichyl-phosphate beta-D-mannosyltransferase [bacterium]
MKTARKPAEPFTSHSPWVVVPTYNEIENIAQLITQLYGLGIDNLTVLIVDDNSPDGTADAVRGLESQFPSVQLVVRDNKAGLGKAYVHGFTYALEHGADAIVQMDADFSHSPKDVSRLLGELQENDLVVGSRYSQGISVVNWPLKRLLISIGGNLYARIITGLPLSDSTGGFKAWRADTLRGIHIETSDADGYGFQIVNNYRAWKQGYQVKEIPIVFTERREGQSKMTTKIIKEAIVLVWRLRLMGK